MYGFGSRGFYKSVQIFDAGCYKDVFLNVNLYTQRRLLSHAKNIIV